MVELRCKGCDKLLAMVDTVNGAIKCPRCHKVFEYHVYSNLFMTNEADPKINLPKPKDSDSI